jgi:hypothetical protein
MKKKTLVRKEGSITLAAILITFIALSVLIALMYRGIQGHSLVHTSGRSNQMYQKSDSGIEMLLQDVRLIDDGKSAGGVNGASMIPENISAYPFCISSRVKCWKLDQITGNLNSLDAHTKLSEVVMIATKSNDFLSGATRAVQAPLPARVSAPSTPSVAVSPPLYTSCTPPPCGTCTKIFIGYNVAVNWNADDGSGEKDGVKLRRTTPSASATSDSVSWGEIYAGTLNGGMTDSDVAPYQSYSYILKATNKNPLRLDSLYAGPVSVTIPPPAPPIVLTGYCPPPPPPPPPIK